jgi:uncharacterized protein YaiL (DUF2058 family)
MSSLRDQLLKAGFVTKEQVKKSESKPKRYQSNKKTNKPCPKPAKKNKPKRELSDLEKFYRQRSNEENKEHQRAKKAKEEATQRKRERNIKISKLINENMITVDNANERYNFIMGTTVKYLYVSSTQLVQLAEGKLALTFMRGKCRIIPPETAEKIRKIDSNRLIIQQHNNESANNKKL